MSARTSLASAGGAIGTSTTGATKRGCANADRGLTCHSGDPDIRCNPFDVSTDQNCLTDRRDGPDALSARRTGPHRRDIGLAWAGGADRWARGHADHYGRLGDGPNL